MAPRGLSLDEKRVKLLEIFHETVASTNRLLLLLFANEIEMIQKDFYQLKELEKLAPKMKGIVTQSVKEVLQSLVDDGLVQGDKIGSSNCKIFWSFPSHQGAIIQGRMNTAKETKVTLQAQLLEIEQSIETEKSIRVESETRSASLAKVQDRKKELGELDDELVAYGACDPVKMEEMKRAITLGKEAAIRWTENYSVLLSHFTRTTQVGAEDVRKHLEIDEEYEDIE